MDVQPIHAPPPVRRTSRAGTIVALAGFGVTVLGLFALPLNSYGTRFTESVGFVETRSNIVLLDDGRGIDRVYSGLAQFWWLWGALAVTVILVALLCVAVGGRAVRAIGLAVAIVALVGGVLHGLAMAQSVDFQSLQQYRLIDDSSFYTHPGAGVFVSLAGFGVLLVGGVLAAALSGRPAQLPAPPAAPPPPPTAPAANPG